MNGQRLTIEEIRGTTDDLQLVDERKRSILRSKVDGEDRPWQRTELCLRQSVEEIIFQTGVVHPFDLREFLTLTCQPQRRFCLTTETDVERIKTECFHVCHLWCHQRTEIRHQFGLHPSCKRQFLPHLLGTSLQSRRRMLRPVEPTVVDEQTA